MPEGTDTTTVHCHRCGRRAESVGEVPQPEALATEIAAKVCADCWREWEAAEVMVINEFHLNFMDPRAVEVLEKNLREFLRLDAEPPAAAGAPEDGGGEETS